MSLHGVAAVPDAAAAAPSTTMSFHSTRRTVLKGTRRRCGVLWPPCRKQERYNGKCNPTELWRAWCLSPETDSSFLIGLFLTYLPLSEAFEKLQNSSSRPKHKMGWEFSFLKWKLWKGVGGGRELKIVCSDPLFLLVLVIHTLVVLHKTNCVLGLVLERKGCGGDRGLMCLFRVVPSFWGKLDFHPEGRKRGKVLLILWWRVRHERKGNGGFISPPLLYSTYNDFALKLFSVYAHVVVRYSGH